MGLDITNGKSDEEKVKDELLAYCLCVFNRLPNTQLRVAFKQSFYKDTYALAAAISKIIKT